MQQEKESIFNKWCWSNKQSLCRQMKIDLGLTPWKNLKSKWIKPDTLDLIEVKKIEVGKIEVGKSVKLIDTGWHFLNRTPIDQALRLRIDKWYLMNLEIFCKTKNIIDRTNQKFTDWENIFTNSTYDRRLIFKYIKNSRS